MSDEAQLHRILGRMEGTLGEVKDSLSDMRKDQKLVNEKLYEKIQNNRETIQGYKNKGIGLILGASSVFSVIGHKLNSVLTNIFN